MTKLTLVLSAAAGLILGLALFLLKRTPSVQRCRQAGPFSREIWLTALIVSSLLASAKMTVANTVSTNRSSASEQTNAKRALQETREWKELQALWLLITDHKNDAFYAKGSDYMPEWKHLLLEESVNSRLAQLQPLVTEGLLSGDEYHAIQILFKRMSYHLYRSRSGWTCYMGFSHSDHAIFILHEQACLLQKKKADGILTTEILVDQQAQLMKELSVLCKLEDSEIPAFKPEAVSKLFQDLNTCDNPELPGKDAIILELTDNINSDYIIEQINSYDSKSIFDIRSCLEVVVSLDPTNAHAHLSPLFTNSLLRSYSSRSASEDERYINYPIRQMAYEALKMDDHSPTAFLATSESAKKAVRAALETENIAELENAVSLVAYTKETSFIPLLLKLAANSQDANLNKTIIQTIVQLEGKYSLQRIIQIIAENELWDLDLHDALSPIDSDTTLDFLQKETLSGSPSNAKAAFNLLISLATTSHQYSKNVEDIQKQTDSITVILTSVERADHAKRAFMMNELIERNIIASQSGCSRHSFDQYLVDDLGDCLLYQSRKSATQTNTLSLIKELNLSTSLVRKSFVSENLHSKMRYRSSMGHIDTIQLLILLASPEPAPLSNDEQQVQQVATDMLNEGLMSKKENVRQAIQNELKNGHLRIEQTKQGLQLKPHE